MAKPLIVMAGASSGIGAVTARLFSARGPPLLLLARRRERLKGGPALPRPLCRRVAVTDRVAVEEAACEVEKRFGSTDAIINNAGMMLLSRIADQPVDERDRMIGLSIKGVLYGTRAVLPGMLAGGNGTLVDVSSLAGRTRSPEAVYGW
ncbi:SDR family oxidoreductase [Streptomyces griseofuscus]|uniref:SDR family oxidoreductase n=1 Tax=Streptomyces griseofuscus TaxID=146922 RepID=UPI003816F59D